MIGRFPLLRPEATRVLFAAVLIWAAAATSTLATSFGGHGTISPILKRLVPPAATGAPIQTVTPGPSWDGTAGSGGNTLVSGGDPTTGADPNGVQSIQAIKNDGGVPLLQVPSTANMYDADYFKVSGTGGGADGLYQIEVKSPTTLHICHRLTGNYGTYSCVAAGALSFGSMAPGGKIGYPEMPPGNFDALPFTTLEAGDGQTLCFISDGQSGAGLKEVAFQVEGSSIITTSGQSIGPSHGWTDGSPGTHGWCIRVANPASGLTGAITVVARARPFHGYDRIVTRTFTLNANGLMPSVVKYVDPINGDDAATGDTDQPWKTSQYCLGHNNAGLGNNVCKVRAPKEPVTFTTGPVTTVNWDSPNNTMVPGATGVFSGGTPPNGVQLGKMYYVSNAGFVAGVSFQITDQIPGTASTVPLVPYQRPQDFPVASSGASSGVSFQGVVTLDPTTKPSGTFLNARANFLQPEVPHTASLERNGSLPSNGYSQWDPTASRTIIRDMTILVGSMKNFQVNTTLATVANESLIEINQSRMFHPRGPMVPEGIPGTQADGTGMPSPGQFYGFIKSSAREHTGWTESVLSMPSTVNAQLYRNVTSNFSWDSFTPFNDSNIVVDNLKATKRGLTLSWPYPEDPAAVPVTAVSYNPLGSLTATTGRCVLNQTAYQFGYTGPLTEITFSGMSRFNGCGIADLRLIVYDGAPTEYYVRGYDLSQQKVWVAGDARALVPGVTRYTLGTDTHSDMAQLGNPYAGGCSTKTGSGFASDNNVVSKYFATPTFFGTNSSAKISNGDYTGDDLNGILGQEKSCSSGTNRTHYDGALTITLDNPVIMPAGVYIGLAPNVIGRVAWTQPSTPTNTITLEYPIRKNDGTALGAQDYTSFTRINVARNFMFENSGWNSVSGDYKFEQGHLGWLFRNDTFVAVQSYKTGNFAPRDDTGMFAGHNFVMQDSIIKGFGKARAANPQNTGIVIDNTQATKNSLVNSTNSNVNAALTLKPGLFGLQVDTGTVLKMGASGRPITAPFTYDNRPRTSACGVGMYC